VSDLPEACPSAVEVCGARFACGGTPGHAPRHYFRAGGHGTLPKVSIEWDDDQAAVAPDGEPGRANPVTAILAVLREAEYPLSVGELVERTRIPGYTLYGYLRSMTHHGDVVKTGRNPSQYSIPDDGASARTGT
jgi:hypothetical protein